jgi:hypothetical protein
MSLPGAPSKTLGPGALSILVLAAASGCALPYALPPAQVDIGADRAFRADEPTAFHLAAGVHAASLGPATIPRSDAVDIGVGYVLDRDHQRVRDQGVYGEAAWFFVRRPHVRLAAGVRGEALFSGAGYGSGAYARLAGELFAQGSGAGEVDSSKGGGCNGGSFRWGGVPATGLYVEAGGQHLPDGREAVVATAGLTVRIPAVAGILLLLPGCGN